MEKVNYPYQRKDHIDGDYPKACQYKHTSKYIYPNSFYKPLKKKCYKKC